MMKNYLKKSQGEYPENFDIYETDEILVSAIDEEVIRQDFFYIEPYIGHSELKKRLFLLEQGTGKVYKEYKLDDIVGIRYFGNTTAFSTMSLFLEQFEMNLSLVKEIVNSKNDGWYTDKNNLRHFVIFEDTQVEFLGKENIRQETVKKTKVIKKNHSPLSERINISKKGKRYKNKYRSRFKTKNEIEEMLELVIFSEKEYIKFVGLETYTFKEAEYYEDCIRYTRLYFLLNERYKITIEYDTLENDNYLVLKKEYRKGLEIVDRDVFLLENKNSEFFRKCYNESGFFENFEEFKRRMKIFTYIADDYVVELVIEKEKKPKIEVMDLDKKVNIFQVQILKT